MNGEIDGKDFKSGEAQVLVVDDNHVNQLLAKAILDQNGYSVAMASNGEEAIETIKNTRYACVLMDIQMPGLDGFEATKRIRDLSSDVKTIPIIAMTANVMEGDRERCINSGMNDYLAKPIDAGLLASCVRRWAGEPSPNRDPFSELSRQIDALDLSVEGAKELPSS